MAVVEVACRYCKQIDQVYRHEKSHAGYPQFRCVGCHNSFQMHDAYEAPKLGVKERIVIGY